MDSSKENAKSIVEIARRLHGRNMLAAGDGNISVRLDSGEILITPSGVAKAFMNESEMASLSIDGKSLKGQPSGESAIHLEIYRRCPKAKAVVHCHPPHAIAWSLSKPELKKLPGDVLPEVILACGDVPFVPYAIPTTEDMATVLRDYLPKHRALILTRHGAVTWGESLQDAYLAMERLEHSAQILYLAFTLGKPKALPLKDLKTLKAMRAQIGEKIL